MWCSLLIINHLSIRNKVTWALVVSTHKARGVMVMANMYVLIIAIMEWYKTDAIIFYCIYAVVIRIKILTWWSDESWGHKKISPRFAISTGIYEHMHKQIIYLKASTHIYVRIRGKHKQAKKERHCACKNIARECRGRDSNPRSFTPRCKKNGIKRLTKVCLTRCDGFVWWQKSHVFERQPPN